tara:strand:- start:746 stop:4600 length:3855 start_codon:yes stop_codon:yes gene_type:complete
MIFINDKRDEDIYNMLEVSIKNKNIEFELLYGKKRVNEKIISTITKEDFHKFLDYFNENYNFYEDINTLDIKYLRKDKFKSEQSDKRLTISGLEDIKKYCLTNIISSDMNLLIIDKKKHEIDDIKNTYISRDYNYKINLKKEEVITDNIDEIIDTFNTNKKIFRYKKRFSYLTNNKLWRIDLTVVKSSNFNTKFNTYDYHDSFKNANILNRKETYELEIEYVGSTIKLNTGLYAIENFIKNKDYFSDNPNIYNPFHNKINLSSDKDYTFDKETTSTTPNYKEYINKRVQILDTYWDKNTDEKIREDIGDNDVIIKEVFSNYDGDYGTGIYVKIETLDDISLIIPVDDIDFLEGLYKGGATDDSIDIIIDDINLDELSIPKELEGKEYIKEQWFPNLDSIFRGVKYTMKKNPSKKGEDYFRLAHLVKYIDTNKELVISKSIADKYKLGSIKKVLPYLVYKNGAYIVKYKIIDIGDEGMADLSLEILIDQDDKIISNIMEELNDLFYDISSFHIDEKIIVSKTLQNKILNEYYKLTKQDKRAYKTFVGPQPSTLKLENLYKENPINILENYLVTEKADGDRYLLYVNKEKNLYLYNKKNDIIDTGLYIPKIKGEWLVDGEYIKKDKMNNSIRLFMIFDVYYCESDISQKAYSHPFISNSKLSRFEILETFKNYLSTVEIRSDYINEDNKIVIDFKSYEKGFINNGEKIKDSIKNKLLKDIFLQSSKIWNKQHSYPYSIDGLIYLPANLPVKADLDGKVVDKISGTWNLNFKWKPPEENTIDFHVSIVKEMVKSQKRDKIIPFLKETDGMEVISKHKQLNLSVKYYAKQDTTINYCMQVLLDKESYNKNDEIIEFSIEDVEQNISKTNIELIEGKMICLKDNREINDNDIIEMRYNKDAKNGMIWEPLRVRSDKGGIPQAYHIAVDVWDSIQNPILPDMIQGKINIHKKIDDYYINKSNTQSSPLRDFHNLIKSKLIGLIGTSFENKIDIMDTSIGRGGDINRYLRLNCNYLFGLDIAPVDSACERFYKGKKKITKGVFIRYDTSKSIENELGYIGTDKEMEHSKNMLNILYNKKRSIPKKYENIRSRYSSVATNGFDIISCQFSLHYYFESEKTLRTYLENITSACKKGGYFIGTCYDGNRILELFGDKNKIEYTKNNETIYKLEKVKISNFKYNKENIKNMFGNSINVFMDSIGKVFTEYLVHFEFFIDIMKEYGFELDMPTKNPINYSKFINKPINSFESILKNLSNIEDKELNTYYKNSLNILKDKELYNLSKTNNYFIFKKN